jgi:pectate lyase
MCVTRGLAAAAAGAILVLWGSVSAAAAQPLAFPGAVGWGAEAVGGRGGTVIHVTNLNDDGPGSLREALLTEGRRIVVFDLGGTIELESPIFMRGEEYSFLTIAGQTAPGGGIQLKQRSSGISDALLVFAKGVHDVVIRYIRIRSYSDAQEDGIKFLGRNMIMDHVSVAYADDENISIYRRDSEESYPPNLGITVQRTLSAYGDGSHSNGLLISGHHDGVEQTHELRQITVWRNLFSSNSHRNPRITSGNGNPSDGGTEVINNVTYNWANRIGSTTRQCVADWINNYAKVGPQRMGDDRIPLLQHEPHDDTASIYSAGNVVEPGIHDGTGGTDWDGLWTLNTSGGGSLPSEFRRSKPLPAPPHPAPVISAAAAYADVIADVGANARLDCAGNWVSNIDWLDQKAIDEVVKGTGSDAVKDINPSELYGWPSLARGTTCPDSDRDGMPDEFEDVLGSDPGVMDANGDLDGDGYTNIEEYLNGQNSTPADVLLPPTLLP